MLKWIRRSSILAIVFLLLIIIALWLFSGQIIKYSVETGGTQMLGAKVDVQQAGMSFSPLGIELDGLQVTNPDQPMQNMFEAGLVKADVKFLPLLAGQVLIENLTAQNVKLDTPRQTSGAVEKVEPESDESKSEFDFSALQNKLPSVDEVLAKEPLKTTENANALKSAGKNHKDNIEKSAANLPDKNQIEDYQARIKAVTDGKVTSLDDLQKRKQELEKIKNEIRNDKKNAEQLKSQIKLAKSDLAEKYDNLKSSPSEDLNQLKARYGLNTEGAANLTALLFGENAKVWLLRIQSWYKTINDIMPASDGQAEESESSDSSNLFAFLKEADQPHFLIRNTKVSAILDMGNLDLTISNITHQPHILGKPIQLNGEGVELNKADSITINGVLDHVKPSNSRDALNWQIQNWQADNWQLSDSESMSVNIKQAQVNMTGDANIQNSGHLMGQFNSVFQNTQWDTSADKGWSAEVANIIAKIPTFKVDGKVSGSITSPNIQLTSDLDKQVKKLASKRINEEQKQWESKLQARLNQEIQNASGPYQEQLALLNKTEGNLDQRLEQLESMLKTQMQSAVDSQKQQAEEKLKDGLQDKLKGFGL